MLNVAVFSLASAALAGVHYVDVNGASATPPYSDWSTAATNIQDAVDAAVAGDEVVVADGYYDTGGRSRGGDSTPNRVAVTKPLNIRSVNGPQSTFILGTFSYYEPMRCVCLVAGASLSGFTLTGGYVPYIRNGLPYGGGVYGDQGLGGSMLNNCIIEYNVVEGNDRYTPFYNGTGAGAYGCMLYNCTLIGNSAYVAISGVLSGGGGGGAFNCTLNNCTLIDNTSDKGAGGAESCKLKNCIVYFNTSPQYSYYSTLSYCCTTPQAYGIGNITNAPLFVDEANGDLRLQPNSPCINAGNNSYVTSATDLDGNPRLSGGTVDIGAYEYQWPQLTLTQSDTNVLLTWPTNNLGYDYTGFTVQSTTNLLSPVVWDTNSPAPLVINGQNTVTNPITGDQMFFRLSQ
jgi:hypothetical protein